MSIDTPKFQVFVSSTYEDLKPQRDAIMKAVLELGHIPVGMELFSAGNDAQWKLIQRQIDESDYYVVIVAHRYGSTIKGISYTEREHDYAVARGIPVLAFIIDPDAEWPTKFVDRDSAKSGALERFKAKLKQRMVDFWQDAEQLHRKVSVSLTKAFQATPRPGWVRTCSAPLNVEAAGLSAFYPSRAFYATRKGAASVDQYIATAEQSVVLVSINLMTGVAMDGMLDVLRRRLESRAGKFNATISLLDPRCKAVITSVAPVLDVQPAVLARDIRQKIKDLLLFRNSLSLRAQRRLRLRLHQVVPFGSAIMLDHRQQSGRIQIETKAYRTPVRKSFAFEVVPTRTLESLYETLTTAYERLIEDGLEME